MDVLDTSKSRLNRVENDIETLRTTQANILDHLDSYSKTLDETRDIDAGASPAIASMDRTFQILRESNAMLWESRAIALAIAEHFGVTIEKPNSSVQPG